MHPGAELDLRAARDGGVRDLDQLGIPLGRQGPDPVGDRGEVLAARHRQGTRELGLRESGDEPGRNSERHQQFSPGPTAARECLQQGFGWQECRQVEAASGEGQRDGVGVGGPVPDYNGSGRPMITFALRIG